MGRLLFLIFTVVPLIEIAFFVVIGQAVGLWPTLLGVLVTALLGAMILRHQGLALFGQIRAALSRGEIPARALADAMMVAMAGVLMISPGYFTDLLGLLLLVPSVRGVLYAMLKARFVVSAATSWRGPDGSGATINLETDRWRKD